MANFKIFFFYFLGFFFNLLIFVTLFNINIGVETFFYKGLIITLASLVIQICFLFIINKLKNFIFNKLHIAIICLSTLCFTLLLHTLVLTSLDRAISVFFISLMNDTKTGLTKKEIKESFYENYFEKDQAIERRINEQLISGNIIKSDDKYFITNRGELIFDLFNFLGKVFNIKNNYIPKYSFEKK